MFTCVHISVCVGSGELSNINTDLTGDIQHCYNSVFLSSMHSAGYLCPSPGLAPPIIMNSSVAYPLIYPIQVSSVTLVCAT